MDYKSIIQPYQEEWNRRNPNDPFAELVNGEVFTVGGQNCVDLYIPIYVDGYLHKQKLMQRLSKGYSFISVQDALKQFFVTFPRYTKFYHSEILSENNNPITFQEALKSVDFNGFHLPKGYILVDELPDTPLDVKPNLKVLPTPAPAPKKIGIGWILLGIAVGGLVLYKIAKK